MSNLLEVTGDDIAKLNDTDLRTLIGLLCEADYRLAGLSTKGITWGGDQNAADSGIDVSVQGIYHPPQASFIPRLPTEFQVKKPDMPRSAILKEMKPLPKGKAKKPKSEGVLRDSIKELIRRKGAYIIVSSNGSTAKTALDERLKAMKDAIRNEKKYEDLHVDFFDLGRVATWVRSHPSMILWVRNKVGRPLQGWQPYDNWANVPDGIGEEYIVDEQTRLRDSTLTTTTSLTIKDGLERLRLALNQNGTSIRLVGLSGVGKTRLVQALFDEKVGTQALNRFQVYYTDISDSPEPKPTSLANQLIAEQKPAFLIVDNCPPDLHRRLTEIVSNGQKQISLLTVEYDVRDDLPEETRVFKLEPASQQVLELLIQKRFSHISQVDVQTIADFAGGNARLAILLASTLKSSETLSGFSDKELLKRLFWQRDTLPNDSLMISASVCALVYSFEGESTESSTSELRFLASLIEQSASELYRDVASLKKRDLIQSRSTWRAILPQAIANRLAKEALAFIPKNQLIEAFLNRGSERLFKSFSRRLSYLHDDEIAIEIATDWLKVDGWLGSSIHDLGGLGIGVFEDVAPIAPEKTLALLEYAANDEKFASTKNRHYEEVKRILWHLAYDSDLFARSTILLCHFALSEMRLGNYDPKPSYLNRLFYSSHSGARALPEIRAKIIEDLVNSDDINSQNLGMLLLGNALNASGFGSGLDFDFGARPRDYGYEPETDDEILHWYKIFIDICVRLSTSDRAIAIRAKKLLSDCFRDLWLFEVMEGHLEESAQMIHSHNGWIEGWFAVRGTIRFVDARKLGSKTRARLQQLENTLKPVTLIERARAFALLTNRHGFVFDDTPSENVQEYYEHLEKTVQEIGVEIARDSEAFMLLLPEMFTTQNPRVGPLGYGLFNGSGNKIQIWENLCTQFKQTAADKRNKHVLLGYLSACAVSDPDLHNILLDEILDDTVLGQEFPHYQTTAPINQRSLERLHKALDIEIVNVTSYRNLIPVHRGPPIDDDQLAELIEHIISIENGFHTGFNLLQNRFHHGKSRAYSEKLIDTARNVLLCYPFDDEHCNEDDFALSQILEACLYEVKDTEFANSFGKNLKQSFDVHHVNITSNHRLFTSFAKECPTIFLDIFLDDNKERDDDLLRMSPSNLHPVAPLIQQIPDSTVLSWCEIESEIRYPLIVRFISTHYSPKDKVGVLEWRPIVYAIFESAPELSPILEELGELAKVNRGGRSRADTMQAYSTLFHDLTSHTNEEIKRWAEGHYRKLQESIPRERELEKEHHQERNLRFE